MSTLSETTCYLLCAENEVWARCIQGHRATLNQPSVIDALKAIFIYVSDVLWADHELCKLYNLNTKLIEL